MRKNYTLIFIFSFLLFQLSTAQIAEKTFVQSFNLQGKSVVSLDMEGDVVIKDWAQDVLRIQMEVQLEKGNPNALKGLATTGRYLLRPYLENERVRITAPGLEKTVTYRGAEVQESVRYTIFVPVGVHVEWANEELAGEETVDAEM
jgi:hypothetical protein